MLSVVAIGHLKDLTRLITRNTYYEHIVFDHPDNILSWLQLRKYVQRKGMVLFASVETPLLSLGALILASWPSFVYCMLRGKGLNLVFGSSTFSNSALATWPGLRHLTSGARKK